jgi:hypothetical protein
MCFLTRNASSRHLKLFRQPIDYVLSCWHFFIVKNACIHVISQQPQGITVSEAFSTASSSTLIYASQNFPKIESFGRFESPPSVHWDVNKTISNKHQNVFLKKTKNIVNRTVCEDTEIPIT